MNFLGGDITTFDFIVSMLVSHNGQSYQGYLSILLSGSKIQDIFHLSDKCDVLIQVLYTRLYTCLYRCLFSSRAYIGILAKIVNSFSSFVNKINSLYPAISIITGDFNRICLEQCSFDTSDNIGKKLDTITSTMGYSQIIDEPTDDDHRSTHTHTHAVSPQRAPFRRSFGTVITVTDSVTSYNDII